MESEGPIVAHEAHSTGGAPTPGHDVAATEGSSPPDEEAATSYRAADGLGSSAPSNLRTRCTCTPFLIRRSLIRREGQA